ncbi:helix-turn-helix domain-containing protein [Amycolatopsis sp. A1MSW2902]|uniref:helix-turn-helix domain-containing protein n=1 Tax=Amycolatopsis sp. A1MSW2902 TaxID=687413 RepID=UPI00307F58E2
MSIEAINWALKHARIPVDRRDSSSLAVVLIGLANHADPDSRNAFPSLTTLAGYTRLSERSVRYALRGLEKLGLIVPADPRIVAAHVQRADRQPNGYDLRMTTPERIDSPDRAAGDEYQASSQGQALPPAEQRGRQNGTERAANNGPARGKPCRQTIHEPSINHPVPREAIRIPPPCGQCDARPGDPIATRSTTDHNGDVRRCPNCHPAEILRTTSETYSNGEPVALPSRHLLRPRSRPSSRADVNAVDHVACPSPASSAPTGGPDGQP